MLKSDKSFLNMRKPIAFISPSGISFINWFYSSINYKKEILALLFSSTQRMPTVIQRQRKTSWRNWRLCWRNTTLSSKSRSTPEEKLCHHHLSIYFYLWMRIWVFKWLVLHGHHDFSWLFREMDQTMGQTGEFDIAEYYRLHLAVEKIR